MKEKNLIELYILKNRLIKKGLVESDDMYQILEAIEYKEKLILEDQYYIAVNLQTFELL
jgi:hypothetical protein